MATASSDLGAAPAANLKVITDALQKLGGIGADEQKQMDSMIATQVETQVNGQPDKAAFCTAMAGKMKDTTEGDFPMLPETKQLIQNARAFVTSP